LDDLQVKLDKVTLQLDLVHGLVVQIKDHAQ
jgi:hypothetical protein